ncbi:MAG TPA: hypothetical protein V6D47_10850, partial [Oscillatoriaceae cyanobacterium]
PEANVDDMLRDLNLPTDARTRAAAYALIARDGTLDQQDLNRLVSDLRQFPDVSQRQAGAAALLQKAQAPVNPGTVSTMLDRANPEAPPQLGQRLMALAPALQQLKRQVRGPAAAMVDELAGLLKGLPLDERTQPGQVSQALKQWLTKLQPDQPAQSPQAPAPQATTARAPVNPQSAAPPPAANAPEGNTTGPSLVLNDANTPATLSPTGPQASAGAIAAALSAEAEALPLPEPSPEPPAPSAAQASVQAPVPAKQALARDRVPASQHALANTGISRVAQPSRDLASLLTRLDQNVGAEHKEIHKLLKEAIAEVRYTQLTNAQPSQSTPEPQEFYVPLLLPQLSPDQPEGRLQVYYKPSRPNEPIDPSNTRLVLVLDTEHLGTVQTDVTIKDGTVDLNLGVPDGADRNFLAEHLQELEKAIASIGWPTGRFAAHIAKKPPPKTHQQEGLSDIVRFDRRV